MRACEEARAEFPKPTRFAPRTNRLLFYITALVFGSLASLAPISAEAQLTSLLLSGDAAPGTGGGSFASFGSPSLNDLGEAAFTANLSGGSTVTGVFVESPTTGTSVVALRGDAAPGSGGTFQTFGGVQINNSGDVAFNSSIVGAAARSGIFVSSGGTVSAAVLDGDPAPGTGGGTFNIPSEAKFNNAGTLAFFARVNGGLVAEGIFRIESGLISAVAFNGTPIPGLPGAAFTQMSGPSLGQGGEIAFESEYFGGGFSDQGIFIDDNGALSAVALEGDIAPGSGGSAFTQVSVQRPPIAPDGSLVFGSGFAGGAVSEFGLFRSDAGGLTDLVFSGDIVPETGGGMLLGISNEVATNAAGDILFEGQIDAGGLFSRGVFLLRNDALEAVALAGDPAPDTLGQFVSFGNKPAVNALGDIAFSGRAQFGIASRGLWFLPEPAFALPLAFGTLLLTGLKRRRMIS
ncbi:MAG: choice-of-anchor tandem repeat NxxGxxAF-containing protein [Myxococcota bacterium]